MKRTMSDVRDEIVISYGEKVFPVEEVDQAKLRQEYIVRSENALKSKSKADEKSTRAGMQKR